MTSANFNDCGTLSPGSNVVVEARHLLVEGLLLVDLWVEDPPAVGVVHDLSALVELLNLVMRELPVEHVEVGAASTQKYIRSCLFLWYRLLFQCSRLPR